MIRLVVLLTFATLALTAPVQAADYTSPIIGIDGKQLKLDDRPDSPPVTMSDVAVNALLATYPDEQSLAGTEKLRRFQIAMKIKDAGKTNLTLPPDDVALVLKLVSKLYNPIVVGRSYELLEPASKAK